MTRPDGTPINAVYGFCRMLVADLLDKPEVDHIAMILDAGEVTFRNEIYDKYKANRPPPPEDLIPQFPLIREAARAFNVTVCELKGYDTSKGTLRFPAEKPLPATLVRKLVKLRMAAKM